MQEKLANIHLVYLLYSAYQFYRLYSLNNSYLLKTFEKINKTMQGLLN